MSRLRISVGEVFTNLTVVEESGRGRQGHILYRCRCICGKDKIVKASHLRQQEVKSCGCLQTGNPTHGLTNTPIYNSYHNAYNRCNTKNMPAYINYGGRGIKFKLQPFDFFVATMKDSWFEGATLGRKDNNGHYEYGNIKWETRQEQSENKRNNKWISFNGRTMLIHAWAKELQITSAALAKRFKSWSIEQALTTPKKGSK